MRSRTTSTGSVPEGTSTPPTDGEGASSSGNDPNEDPVLLAREKELTREVPQLLETMNRMSSEVNTFEREVGQAQARYRQLLEQWSRLYEELREKHGSAIDKVKPYFDVAQTLNAALQRVQGVVREFSAAASQHAKAKVDLRAIEVRLAYGAHKVQLQPDQQDELSRATARVVRCQQERDRREQEYARALREYQEAQEALEVRRAQIGDSLIKRTMPCFRRLQQHQVTLANEQNRINTFTERARAAKAVYNSTMRELDRVNVAVHTARRDHAASLAASLQEVRAPPPPPEEAPEVSPEMEPDFAAKAAAAARRLEAEVLGEGVELGNVTENPGRMYIQAGDKRPSITPEDDDGPFA